MSSTTPEDSTNPEPNLTPDEIADLIRLEAIAQRGIRSYVQVGDALAEIRDRQLYRSSHPSFESYARERWSVDDRANRDQLTHATVLPDTRARSTAEPDGRTALRTKPCEAFARACEQTMSALDDDECLAVEIRFAVRKQGDPDPSGDRHSFDGPEVDGPIGEELVPELRWLLAQASGTIGEVAHQLETRAAEFDDGARARLRDDILLLDGELAVVKALLTDLIDWDSELGRLLGDDVPPLDRETDDDE